jgi:uncharacterized protein (TIGR02246 family)
MTWTRERATVAVLLFVSFPLAMAWGQSQSNTADADSTAIKQAVADYTDAFNRHDGHATGASFTEDADLTNMRGMSNHGRKEVEEHYASIYAGFLKNAHRTDSVKSIRFVTPSTALVDSDWEMTGSKAPDGSNIDLPLRKGLLDLVMTKQNGRWLISIFHETEFPSAPAK